MTVPGALCHNVPARLQKVAASLCGALAAPVPPLSLADRALHFAGSVRFALDHVAAVPQLDAVTRCWDGTPTLAGLLPLALQQSMAITSAEFGDLRLIEPRSGALVLVTAAGFSGAFVDHFAIVEDGSTLCGRAAAARTQLVVRDLSSQGSLVAHRSALGAVGVAALQSTPLIAVRGRLIGVLSTHSSSPRLPDGVALQLVGLLAYLVADEIAARLPNYAEPPTGPAPERLVDLRDDPLVAPLDRDHPTVPTARRRRVTGHLGHATRDAALVNFADVVVPRLFETALRLDGARSLARGDRGVLERLVEASEAVDEVIRHLRTVLAAGVARSPH